MFLFIACWNFQTDQVNIIMLDSLFALWQSYLMCKAYFTPDGIEKKQET